jgi:hypothetical protein
VRERYILVRDREKLPAHALSLIETLCAHYREMNTTPHKESSGAT